MTKPYCCLVVALGNQGVDNLRSIHKNTKRGAKSAAQFHVSKALALPNPPGMSNVESPTKMCISNLSNLHKEI